ncbi:MAG TPA: GNAT family N-acetyltransferase [Miltoncostaeaceae bacterium]|nr:GNAT family N-acetyltransferase [Miltoncostaeaceae bacterium]
MTPQGGYGTVVRHAHPGEHGDVAAVLVDALGSKYRPALGPHAQEALAELIAAELDGGSHGYVVAERGGRVVGAAHLATAEDPPPPPAYDTLAQTCGRLRAVWALAVLSLLGHGRLARDEAHVSELAVHSGARRQGVGRALLRALDDEARARGKRRVTLWVTWENAGARALYEGHGYREVRREPWRMGRWVFGARGAALMERRLPE